MRIGLHVGEGAGDSHDYHGPAVNRAARVMAAGHGGQILLSGPTAALVMDQLPAGTALQELGEHLLKDLARPEHVYRVDHPAMPGAGAQRSDPKTGDADDYPYGNGPQGDVIRIEDYAVCVSDTAQPGILSVAEPPGPLEHPGGSRCLAPEPTGLLRRP